MTTSTFLAAVAMAGPQSLLDGRAVGFTLYWFEMFYSPVVLTKRSSRGWAQRLVANLQIIICEKIYKARRVTEPVPWQGTQYLLICKFKCACMQGCISMPLRRVLGFAFNLVKARVCSNALLRFLILFILSHFFYTCINSMKLDFKILSF